MDNDKIIELVKEIVYNLVVKDFLFVHNEDKDKLLSIDEMGLAIHEYPGVLTMPPKEAFESMSIYEVSPIETNIDFDLWYDNSQSDLTLSCNLKMYEKNKILYTIKDIHIL